MLEVSPAARRPDRGGLSRIVATGLLALFLALGPVAAQSVEIVSPRHLATVLGPTTVEVQVSTGGSATVERLEIFVDGESLATLTQAPWKADWDAGDGAHGHRVEAVLYLTDGRSMRSSVRTSPLRINELLEVDLVNVYPLVLDASGAYVTGLTREDFRVYENDQLQEIERFTTEQRPLRVAIVLDTSLSMAKGGRLDNAKKAALGFLEALLPQDDALVVTFSDNVRVVQDVTHDRGELSAAIEKAEAQGGTALYDAIWRTARRLETFDGRRVMILLSDGRDEASNGFEPGSLHTLQEAELQTVRSEVMVFAIGLGRNLDREFAREWTRTAGAGTASGGVSLKEILESLAVTSGGRLLLSPSASKLRKAFVDVAKDLRHQYSLAYKPSDDSKDGKYREIRVTVPERDVEVVVRKGYYAPLGRSGS
jgi:Ca-activated chloride channel family protein